MDINIYMKINSSTALGPYKRYVLWVQGCNRKCKGCIAIDSWNPNNGTLVDADVLADEILSVENIEGITISGGEPFLQENELSYMLGKIKSKSNLGVIIYTGYKFDEIKNSSLTKYADLIIDGEYVEELNDNLSLRGSSNQNVIVLTERYSDKVDEYYGAKGRKTELIFDKGRVQLVGIPTKKNLKLYKGENKL